MSNRTNKAVDPSYAIERLHDKHDIGAFDCGEESMNAFLTEHARKNAELGFGITYVLVSMDSLRVLGYYTLSAAGMMPKEVFSSKERYNRGVPPYQIPVIRLGRLAVDSTTSGKGLGRYLLIDAMRRAVVWSRDIGAYGMDAHAINAAAVPFYTNFGFETLRDSDFHVFMPMKTIQMLVEE